MNKENTETLYVDPFKVQQIRVAVDAVCIANHENKKYVLLIKRAYEPFTDHWALPGGFLNEKEEMETGVIRELKEETNIDVNIKESDVKQIKAYGKVGRDPRPRRIVSVAYLIELEGLPKISNSNESLHVEWVPLDSIKTEKIAFDHKEIILDGMEMIEQN
jgi:8-oxo-dGTP diphosphatase